MHASPALLAAAALLGIAIPLSIDFFTANLSDTPLLLAIRLISLAIVPIAIARIAYRQGYDAAAAARTPPTK